ncbi:hypothetical protein TSAR_014412 [Trichomalopsis sarcophagae]|uniref:MENTAL domain-containing protein n=1 Tax=Trichomalopsis sarcophagae TaxID=543379 RepID=A0A232EU61_9HYME|nr:hypothetical protein TSAR_014412 [Trichomalopsis sarcophagae]
MFGLPRGLPSQLIFACEFPDFITVIKARMPRHQMRFLGLPGDIFQNMTQVYKGCVRWGMHVLRGNFALPIRSLSQMTFCPNRVRGWRGNFSVLDYIKKISIFKEDRRNLKMLATVTESDVSVDSESLSDATTDPNTVNEASHETTEEARNVGRLSNARRFFCLFVTFDFFFTFFMWLICVVTAHTIFQKTIVQEIINYTMETSLFDVVVITTCRFVILIAFYLVLRMDHWCVVALTTASTCAFLLAKIFLYNWSQSSQPFLHVLFIIVSFVLVWAEVCRLDIPLPHDIQTANSNSGLADSETTPLHYSYVQVSILPRENVSYFYTPPVSPNQSDEEEVDRTENSRACSLPITIAKRIPYDPFLYMNN